MIVSAIGQGLLWGILGLGIFMTYRILNFPDMTTEGSFPLGGVCVTAITHGVSPVLATCLEYWLGCAGCVTGLLYTKGKIPVILAGILVMSSLNSVMLFVMRSPNLFIKPTEDFFTRMNLPNYYDTVIIGLIMVLLIGASWFTFSIRIWVKLTSLQVIMSIWQNRWGSIPIE